MRELAHEQAMGGTYEGAAAHETHFHIVPVVDQPPPGANGPRPLEPLEDSVKEVSSTEKWRRWPCWSGDSLLREEGGGVWRDGGRLEAERGPGGEVRKQSKRQEKSRVLQVRFIRLLIFQLQVRFDRSLLFKRR